VTGPTDRATDPRWRTVQATSAGAQRHLLVEAPAAIPAPAGWEERSVTLEELAMAYLRGDSEPARDGSLEAVR
jgi:hypothetical protein